ncbi:hypothetical protein RND71_018388 [Anisodus tanguticus]|uniref:NEDD8-activating enzyme E1 regulatory subunit n=1 Tax=Anisodus tanguticus TaxID=243964 RepID=A0AAE1S4P7_9SOLA|nr:hypothetical protein RND71_018388 [Anisodus tanguticus]
MYFSFGKLGNPVELVEDSMVKLDRTCKEAIIILIFARSYGLMGLVRISVKEHTVIESKPDQFLDDLQFNNPWPELRRSAVSLRFPLCMTSCSSICRLYVNLQKTYQAKAEADFLVMEQRVRNLLEKIGRDPASISKANIKSFSKNARTLAHMPSRSFTMAAKTVDPVRQRVARYRLVEDEFNSPVQPELQKTLQEANSLKLLPENSFGGHADSALVHHFLIFAMVPCADCDVMLLSDVSVSSFPSVDPTSFGITAGGLYILLRAADRFAVNYNKFPGQFDSEMDEDISRLKTTAVGLLNDLGCNISSLSEDLINEMCRYGASKLHAVASFVGGVASQEVIKLITRQFIPMSGTFIFNGIDNKSQLLLL